MASSTPSITSLAIADDFFLNVLVPNYNSFFLYPSTFASVVNLGNSLYHFHEWIYDTYRAKLDIKYAQVFSSSGNFWAFIETQSSSFGYIRDMTNASKHVTIGKRPASTGMTHFANTHITVKGFGVGGYGLGKYGGAPDVTFDDGGRRISFDQCAKDLFNFWKSALEDVSGKIYVV